jgi:hypothetical protein
MLLDTCSFAEWSRRLGKLQRFSDTFYERCALAAKWLSALIEPENGRGPNLGANDGTRLFVLHRLSYDDYRPTVQWAGVNFLGGKVYAAGLYDEQLAWLQCFTATDSLPGSSRASRLWPDGGYAKLVREDCSVLLRLPKYRFRPSHADALHLDLWVRGCNVTRDGGTYSYSANADQYNYFSGTRGHCTVQFDGRDQMPRLSRFLFGEWIECRDLSFDDASHSVSACYCDYKGAIHRREVSLANNGCCEVIDRVSEFRDRATLRWRLASTGGEWRREGNAWTNGTIRIVIQSAPPVAREELCNGWESLRYDTKTDIQVLEVEVNSQAKITTQFWW